ncbi:unnamed protein product [Trichobilharzia regenti]|nr:unnamed protein product [Trichobilharzia regenti]
MHKVDKDKNGYITTNEIYDMLAESGNGEKFTSKELQAFIREYDQDGDGKLNYHEFLDYLLDQPTTDDQNHATTTKTGI